MIITNDVLLNDLIVFGFLAIVILYFIYRGLFGQRGCIKNDLFLS